VYLNSISWSGRKSQAGGNHQRYRTVEHGSPISTIID